MSIYSDISFLIIDKCNNQINAGQIISTYAPLLRFLLLSYVLS